jgi:hypothetical protein
MLPKCRAEESQRERVGRGIAVICSDGGRKGSMRPSEYQELQIQYS